MKAVTEFPSFTLNQALKTQAALTAEGKTPEEVQASLATSFKLEGDKLKYFINSLEVAGKNVDNLKRVLVVSLAEGETVPNKSSKVEELHYVPEFYVEARTQQPAKAGGKFGARRGGGGDRPKGSPWGLSPEEKAAKNKGPAAKATKPS